ncbi:tyrosyl-tRNA synthetase [Sphaerochaeta pleomorpha str. Grapes]|uniref:Tyrosine--tRNA ligase n=1 Tax=Sphaerochaeta pleomorpha (strain ATCC BAA-1885 / DSM 22778 / Grapes) TaxID=158190 RepID=G8QW07_SPHPG|nr:tyrosine--tRNA ligase [Sphaerochaeta pleomorpha]AEV30531.1 tyrosyl-tRNA synthetase [Sphaerochaeta pleomorpha str. Grapes]
MSDRDTIQIMIKGVVEHSAEEEIKTKLDKVKKENRPLRVKLGLDPSAPDIHLGHAVVLRKLRQLQEQGHTAIIIIGDFTGMIGDPTGKSKTRKPLTKDEVLVNARTYEKQIFRILVKEQTEIHFNSSWLNKLTFSDVITLASKCTVARMLERDDFTKRFTKHEPIAVHEFFYPLMQAYDSVAIEADVELGGTDQIFNILMGRNIQKDYSQDPQITLFMPLLEGVDGVEKMSKSLGNYIGIDEDANIMFEKIMKIPDGLILKYFNLCTDMHPNEVETIRNRLAGGENPRDIKIELAREIVSLYHSHEETASAENYFRSAFQQGRLPDDAPVIAISPDVCENVQNTLLEELMIAGKYTSKSELRRLFSQGAVSINNEKVFDVKTISLSTGNNIIKIGKGRFFLVVLAKDDR